jgi:hypothetical protein
MNKIKRILSGGFRTPELRVYLAAEATLFWGLIFVSWLSYPADHRYSIMTHTFSFLGSFEDTHNPDWWWIFSIAMLAQGFGLMPVVLYMRRCFAAVSGWASRVGALFLLAGCCGIIGVALFPDARPVLFGTTRWTDIHEKAAVLTAIGFGAGTLWHGGLLLFDRFSPGRRRMPHRRIFWPYLFWISITGTGIAFLTRWEGIYRRMREEAARTGAEIGSSWSEALNTRYAFPLWENIGIYTLFIFLIWLALVLPPPEECEKAEGTGSCRP